MGIVESENEDIQSLKMISDAKDVYKAPAGSGIHPREASRHHIEVGAGVIERALSESKLRMKDLDFIAYAAGPGLGPCLRVGAVSARSLSSYYRKPLVPVNHAIGHIELGKGLCHLFDPLVLVISGGHTALTAKQGNCWKIFGETLDLTLGQLLDQLGRFLGLSSPAGPSIETFARQVNPDSEAERKSIQLLPYSIKGNDVSYSGLLSASKALAAQGMSNETVSYAVQEVAFSILTEATERALAFTGKAELLATGGVAANQRLSEMLRIMCEERRATLGVIPKEFAGDCGSQIAAAGFTFYWAGQTAKPSNSFIRQSWRIDSVCL